MTLHWASVPVVGLYCGLALGYIDMLIDHAGETRRPYLQAPVTDAEHHLRLLLLPDINETPIPCVSERTGMSNPVNRVLLQRAQHQKERV